MTREEAVMVLKKTLAYESDFAEAKRMAIEALSAPTDGDVIRCKDCYWYDKGKNDCDSWKWCKRHKFDSYDEGFCSWATHKKQVTDKLKKPCDSLLTDDSAECKEQKSKLDLISRADAIACLSHGEGCGNSCRKRINALPSARPTNSVRFADEKGIPSYTTTFATSAETLQNLAEPNKELKGSDLISRAEALQYIDKITNSGCGRNKSLEYIRKYVERMDSARPTGEWVDIDDEPYCKCSKCGTYIDSLDDYYSFCPFCGADMRGGEDE